MNDNTPESIAYSDNIGYLPQGSSIETILTTEMPERKLVTAVYGLIFSDNTVLLTQGVDDNHHDLEIPGGHLEHDEDPINAIKNKIKNETGVEVGNICMQAIAKVFVPNEPKDNKYPTPYSYMIFYLGTMKDTAKTNNSGFWISVEQARENPWVKENRSLFESLYNESKCLDGKFEKTFIEVCDTDGNGTGQTYSYDTIHRQGLWHKGVRVYVLNSKGEFLIQRRGQYVHTFPNVYESTASGHVDAGASSAGTAIKELREETDIIAKEEELVFVGSVEDKFTEQDGTIINNEIDDVYIIHKDFDIHALPKTSYEIEEFRVFDAKEFLEKGKNGDKSIIYRPNEFKILFDYLFPYKKNKGFNMSDQG